MTQATSMLLGQRVVQDSQVAHSQMDLLDRSVSFWPVWIRRMMRLTGMS